MSKTIYKMFMGTLSEAWYRLTKDEQDALMKKMADAGAKHGVKSIVFCDSSWSSDGYQYFGVEEYPSLEAVQNYHAALSELDWQRYMENPQSLLGTAMPSSIYQAS